MLAKKSLTDRSWLPFAWGFALFAIGILPHVFFESTWDSLGYVQAYQAIVDGSFRIALADTTWHVFAVHFWPLGVLLTPLFAVFPGYVVLVACQSAWVAASLPALRRLMARRELTDKKQQILTFAWMANPLLWGIHLESREGFQLLTACIPLILWGQWAWEERRNKTFLAIGIAMLLLREDVALTVGAWCLFLLLKDWRRKSTWTLLVAASVWFPFVLLVVVRYFSGGAYQVGAWGFEWAGATPGQVMVHVVMHPFSTLGHMLNGSRLAAVGIWLLGTAAGPVFSPLWVLPALPQLGVNFLSDQPNFHLPVFRYSAPALPFLWLAAIDSANRMPILVKALKLLPWTLPLVLAALGSKWVGNVKSETVAVMSCLERELPSGIVLGVTNYKGVTRLWEQDRRITALDKETAKDTAIDLHPWVLIDHGRGSLNLFGLDDIAPLEKRLESGARHHLHWQKAGLSLWGPADASPPCP
jgi:uncharacterized membrane protein